MLLLLFSVIYLSYFKLATMPEQGGWGDPYPDSSI